MGMRYIAVAECDDCPPTPVLDEDYITICKIDDEYLGVSRCQYCRRPLQYWMSEEDANQFAELGVNVITWV